MTPHLSTAEGVLHLLAAPIGEAVFGISPVLLGKAELGQVSFRNGPRSPGQELLALG